MRRLTILNRLCHRVISAGIGRKLALIGLVLTFAILESEIIALDWEGCAPPGLGDSSNYEVSALCVFNTRLFAGTSNSSGGEIWFSENGTDWFLASSGGFGDSSNTSISALCVFSSYLYAGTSNSFGCEMWRSPDGATWLSLIHI